MTQIKIPKATAKRKGYNQTANITVQMTVACPTCHSLPGYYCLTPTGNKKQKYHESRFNVYISKHRKKS